MIVMAITRSSFFVIVFLLRSVNRFAYDTLRQEGCSQMSETSNAALQLRRAISIQSEVKKLLEKNAIAPSAARLCSRSAANHRDNLRAETFSIRERNTIVSAESVDNTTAMNCAARAQRRTPETSPNAIAHARSWPMMIMGIEKYTKVFPPINSSIEIMACTTPTARAIDI